MSAQFVARALSYCLGRGQITLRGVRKRPWLELKRSETERHYLLHQTRTLKQLHGGPIDIVSDRIPTDGFYDIERIRLHGDNLWRAYELLYPRDQRTLSRHVLDLTGLHGLASLWLDYGTFAGRKAHIKGRFSSDEAMLIADWIKDLGFAARVTNAYDRRMVSIQPESQQAAMRAIRPVVHPSMRKKLWAKHNTC